MALNRCKVKEFGVKKSGPRVYHIVRNGFIIGLGALIMGFSS